MTKAEIMNCAAVLAAGIIASEKRELSIGAAEAVGLMEQIASLITDHQKSAQKEHADKWIY